MRQFLTLILTILTIVTFGQSYSKCKVFQYIGNDSLNQKLVKEFRYNSIGKLISAYNDDFKECLPCGSDRYWEFNVYDDTRLISTTGFNYHTKDSSRTIFSYNLLGQKVKEEYFNCTKKLRKGVDKGFGRPNGCVLFDTDFEKDRTWTKSEEKIFQYDNRGNIIITKSSMTDNFGADKHIFTYDLKNRVIVDSAFWGPNIHSTEIYNYSINSYQAIHTSFDNEGKPILVKKEGYEYRLPYFITYNLNEKEQVIEKIWTDERGGTDHSIETLYDQFGKVKKEILFNSKGLQEITHIYLYE